MLVADELLSGYKKVGVGESSTMQKENYEVGMNKCLIKCLENIIATSSLN